ncbi:MAG: CoA pyrophosphatase [Saprospiraceae bacterium]|nr:CoA pyrophosphatase [Saprospiraceae bacterium]
MTNTDPFILQLREKLAGPLPGRAAQYRMASMRRLQELDDTPIPPLDARVACVLHLLHRRHEHDDWRTVLIQRTTNPRDRHSGQISFPGGRWEESDGDDLAAAALREAHEEIGVSPLEVELIGRLTDLYIPVSNFLVHPFVGVLLGRPEFQPQPGEVENILTPPIRQLNDPLNRKMTDISIAQGLTIREVPYFDVEGHVLWGATAMILSEFFAILDQ